MAPLMHQLHGLRATGVLQVQHGKKRKQVQLRDGSPIAVRSNLVQETLGHLLLASGKITEDVLHASLRRVKRGEGMHGQILKAMHMLDEADLATALRLQAQEKLLDMFGWSKGSFRFHRDARLKSANALSLNQSAANLIWQGGAANGFPSKSWIASSRTTRNVQRSRVRVRSTTIKTSHWAKKRRASSNR